MQVTKAVVPAAGLGTRLYPVTKSLPKEMLPLGTRPTIQGVAEEIEGAGITDVLLVTSASKRAIEDHFDRGGGESDEAADRPFPLKARYYYTRQESPRGLGDAVRHGRQFAGGEHFVVALGDCVLISPEPSGPVRRMIRAHTAHEADATICVHRVSAEATRRYGIVAPGATLDGGAIELVDIVEKPGPEAAPSRLAVAARYVFSPEIFEYLEDVQPGYGKEIQLTDAIRAMIADGRRVLAMPLGPGELRLDVGDFGSYGRSFIRAMLTDPEHGVGLRSYACGLLAHLDDPSSADPDVVEEGR